MSLAFVWGIAGTGEFPAQMASNAEMFPFDDFIMQFLYRRPSVYMPLHNDGFHDTLATNYYIQSSQTKYVTEKFVR